MFIKGKITFSCALAPKFEKSADVTQKYFDPKNHYGYQKTQNFMASSIP